MNMDVLFSEDELSRVKIRNNNDDTKTFTVDVHGMTIKTAKRFIKNIIALNRDSFNMNIIHGFNNGCSIKEMLRNTFLSERITKIDDVFYNEGMTVLQIA